MSTETATTVLYIITAIAAVVWISAFEFLRRLSLSPSESAPADLESFSIDAPAGRNVIAESLEVKGDPATLSGRLTSVLARDGLTMFGPVTLTKVTNSDVGFETVAHSASSRVVGQVSFRPEGGGLTDASYRIELPRARGLMASAWIVQTLGLVAIILAFWLIKTQVVDSPNSAIRAQAFQMVQVIHILWPPFLLGGLAIGQRRAVRNQMHALISNLPYLPE